MPQASQVVKLLLSIENVNFYDANLNYYPKHSIPHPVIIRTCKRVAEVNPPPYSPQRKGQGCKK